MRHYSKLIICFTTLLVLLLHTVCLTADNETEQINAKIINNAIEALVTDDNTKTMGIQLAIFKNGKVRYSNAVGFANYETKELLTTKHKLRYASVSKLFTALGVQKLAEQGKIKLTDPANDYLNFPLNNPNYPDETITIKDLLNHLSSVRDDDNNYVMPYPDNINGFFTPDNKYYAGGAHWADNSSGQHRPGEYFYYSNLGYGLLGTIIENVTNQRFDHWIRSNILKPLGISGSFNVRDLKKYPVSNIYKYDQDKWRLTLNEQINKSAKDPYPNYKIGDNGSLFSPQGGMRASSEELASAMQWFISLSDNGPISLDGLKMLEQQNWIYDKNLKNGNNYDNLFMSFGAGIQCTQDIAMADRIVAQGGVKLCGHLGEAYGLLSGFLYDRQNGWGVAYALSGTSTFSKSLGQYSAFYLWEEKILSAVVNAIN